MKASRWLWLTGAALAMGGLGVSTALPQRERPEAATPPAPSAGLGASATPTLEAPPAPGEPVAARCTMSAGTRLAWRLKSVVTAELDVSRIGVTGDVQLPPTRTQFNALLDVEALRGSAFETVLLARFHHLDPESTARVGAMDSAFLLRVGPDCGLAGFARARDAALPAARQQQATAQLLWFVVPSGERAEAQGADGTGRFTAVVARGEDERGAFAQRRITGYTAMWAGARETLSIKHSLLTVRYGTNGWFDSMEGTDVMSGAGLTRGESQLTVTPQALDGAALASASRDEASYVWEDLLPRPAAAPATPRAEVTVDERRQKEALGRLTFGQALQQFAAQVAHEPNLELQWRGISQYLETRPDQVPTFAAALLHDDLPAPMKVAGYLAMGKANVPQARDALLAIHSARSAPPYDRVRSALALAGRGDVGVELAQQLHRESVLGAGESSFIAHNALLALTIMSGEHPGRNTEVDHEARAAVQEALERARTPGELGPVFGAIGNLGTPELLPTIQQWSRNPDPEVRAVVPKALRRLPLETSLPVFLEWLRRETYPPVKEAIYLVLHHQHLDARQDIGRELATQAIADLKAQPLILTRQSLVRLLGPVATTYPDVQQALVEQVKLEVGSGSGLYSTISQYVPGDAISVALNQLPEFNGGRDAPRDERAAAPVDVVPPAGAMPGKVTP